MWFLGYPDQARQLSHESLRRTRDLTHPFTLAGNLWWVALFHQFRREPQAVQAQLKALLPLATEHGFSLWLAAGTMLHNLILVE